MGRPLTGKTHVGIRRETRSNGDVYVYERVTGYDPKTQKTKTLSTRLLGKILAGSTEMIPTRPKRSVPKLSRHPSRPSAPMSDFKKSSSGQVMNPVLMRISRGASRSATPSS